MANLPSLTQVKWPFGVTDRQVFTQAQYTAGFLSTGAAGSLGTGVAVANQIWIQNNHTILEISAYTAGMTLNLAIDSKLQDGASLIILSTQPATPQNVTPGTGFEAATPVLTGVTLKVDCIEAVLSGGVFKFVGGWSNVR